MHGGSARFKAGFKLQGQDPPTASQTPRVALSHDCDWVGSETNPWGLFWPSGGTASFSLWMLPLLICMCFSLQPGHHFPSSLLPRGQLTHPFLSFRPLSPP